MEARIVGLACHYKYLLHGVSYSTSFAAAPLALFQMLQGITMGGPPGAASSSE